MQNDIDIDGTYTYASYTDQDDEIDYFPNDDFSEEDHHNKFDAVLSRNTSGIEPMGDWSTADLVELSQLIDVELQLRATPDER